jgi:hypothetical protein
MGKNASRLRRGLPAITLVALACLGAGSQPATAATTSVSARVDAMPMENPLYQRATGCRHRNQRGTVMLQRWLGRNALGDSWGIENCRRISTGGNWSLHAEGRALDWRLDAGIPREKRAAERLIARLLAPDSQGRPEALARRMGLQEIIFNCRIWIAGWRTERYQACNRRGVDRSTAHKDHIHFGLNWYGARGYTSFWKAGAPDLNRLGR